MRYKNFSRLAGFTLIEVMIAVVIVGILTAIALPNYSEYIRRSERLEARTTMFEAASWMEREFSLRHRYSTGLPASLSRSPKTGKAKYEILATPRGEGWLSYKIVAIPQTTPPDKCGIFTLDETGTRGLEENKASVEECWR